MQTELSRQNAPGYDLRTVSLADSRSEARDLLVIGERLERELHRWNITVIPTTNRVTIAQLRER